MALIEAAPAGYPRQKPPGPPPRPAPKPAPKPRPGNGNGPNTNYLPPNGNGGGNIGNTYGPPAGGGGGNGGGGGGNAYLPPGGGGGGGGGGGNGGGSGGNDSFSSTLGPSIRLFFTVMSPFLSCCTIPATSPSENCALTNSFNNDNSSSTSVKCFLVNGVLLCFS